MRRVAEEINCRYGEGTVHLTLNDSYYNMREKIEPCFYIVKCAEQAMKEEGITPVSRPIRGGTTGAHLSFEGLPCPNLCTGGENFHSRFEFASVEAMEKVTALLVRLVQLAGKASEEAYR
jgi:tripeptide aminopeptidase